MADEQNPLNDVIKVLKVGADFYDTGAENVEDANLSSLFRRMAGVRRVAIADLAAHTDADHDDLPSGDWAQSLTKWYGEKRAQIGDDQQWVTQLEEQEDRTLDAIKSAMTDAVGTPEHATLERHLAAFRETHDGMKELKDRLAA